MSGPAVEQAIVDVLDSLVRLEAQLKQIDRNRVLTAIDTLEKIDVDALRDAVEQISHVEHDMRMARLRIKALTGIMPSTSVENERPTPVEPVQARRKSSQTLGRVTIDPKKP